MPTTTYTFRIEGMHCGSCALLIDDALADLPGIRSTQTSVKQGRSTVELDPGQCTPSDVLAAIADLGYTATQHR
ncbi:MAG: heavy-metal-associated domain-containing protein [Pseudonocardiaceae bacterium]